MSGYCPPRLVRPLVSELIILHYPYRNPIATLHGELLIKSWRNDLLCPQSYELRRQATKKGIEGTPLFVHKIFCIGFKYGLFVTIVPIRDFVLNISSDPNIADYLLKVKISLIFIQRLINHAK